MSSYAAFLGHQPHISLAELTSFLPDFTITHHVGQHVITFETQEQLSPRDLSLLGGTILLAKALPCQSPSLDSVPQLLRNEIQRKRGKASFSLRTEGISKERLRALLRECKEFLRHHGIPSRYIGNERHPAASALLHALNILEGKEGCELTILANEEWLWIGKTIAAHDPNAYAKRDVGKPARNLRTGLLPPKIAQIMLNLGWWLLRQSKNLSEGVGLEPVLSRVEGGPTPGGHHMRKRGSMGGKPGVSLPCTVLDPFCGMGVIPMECLLRRWSVLASDKSDRAVQATETNLDWLRKEEKIFKKDVPATVWQHDACKPFICTEHPDLIVTETTLGPPLSSRASLKEAKRWKTKNEELQGAFLRNLALSLPGVPLICVWPVWYLRGGPLFLERVWGVMEKTGFRAVLPPGIQPEWHGRCSLLYRRPDQFVGREIVLLKPK